MGFMELGKIKLNANSAQQGYSFMDVMVLQSVILGACWCRICISAIKDNLFLM